MKQFYITLFIPIIFLSCNAKKEQGGNIEVSTHTINVNNVEKKEKILFSDYFSKVTAIVLETHDDAIIGDVSGIQVTDSLIFILDKLRTNSLYAFKKDGTFVRRIGSNGQGPEEYIDVSDFTIDPQNEEIYLMDPESNKINIYNYQTGQFIRSIKLGENDINTKHIQYFDNKLYADAFFYDMNKKEKYLLQEIDPKTGTQVGTFLDANAHQRNWSSFSLKDESFFYSRNSGQPKYIRLFMNTVIGINEDGISSFLTLEDNQWVTVSDVEKIKEDTPENFLLEKIHQKKISYDIFNFMECGDLIFFGFRNNFKQTYIFYDRKNNNFNITNEVENDLLYCKNGFLEKIGCADKNGVYGYISSYAIPIFKNFITDGYVNKNIKNYEALENISEDSNPILIYYEK
ncbi:6-bladed beta-propeller [Parabacteroides sp. OttesenSCG-928-J18]|nr:6-bladed beta-propeller [Parabacteroides sp. OttesenSCG-928-J18]